MKKTVYSYLLIFLFSLSFAQEKRDWNSVDSDGDGVLDKDDKCPIQPGKYKGCPNDKCADIYEKEKKQYEIDDIKVKNTDFSTLFDKLFENEEFKAIRENNRKIFLLYVYNNQGGPECGNDPYYDCHHYEKEIFDVIFQKLWKKSNFIKFQKLVGNKIIIPMERRYFSDNMMEDSYLVKYQIFPRYIGTLMDMRDEKRKFYYTTNVKPTKNLILHKDYGNMLKEEFIKITFTIEPVIYKEFPNTYSIWIYQTDEKEKDIEKKYYYQYKDGKWMFLK